MAIQKRTFFEGIDSDTVDELLTTRDRYRLNVRVMSSDNSTVGAIETVNGNTLVNFTLPIGNNTVIGSREDLIRKKVYYFIYNNLQNHSVLEFDSVTNTIAKIFQDAILNFDIDHLITGINFIEIDENNHLLYWTDFFNEPRKINIEKGKYFMNGDYINGYSFPFNPENIYRIKQPMLRSPVCIYGDDLNISINKLDKKLFQFKVQFVYDDNEVSSWSPISKTRFPLSNLTLNKNNVINVTVDTGIEIVKRIRIAVKQVNGIDFGLVIDLDKTVLNIANNSTYIYKFYNDGNYLPLLEIESNKLFDNVPLLSQSQEIIFGNRITDGLITEGYDPVDVDLKIDYTLNTNEFTYEVDYITVVAGGKYSLLYGPAPVVISGNGSGATAELIDGYVSDYTINNRGFACVPSSPSITIYNSYTGSGATATAHYDALGRLENGNPPYGVVITNGGSGYLAAPLLSFNTSFNTAEPSADLYISARKVKVTNPGSGYTNATAAFVGFPGSSLAVALTAKNFVAINALKRGGAYVYGVVYYDHANRSGLTNINEGRFDTIQSNNKYGTTLFIPFYTEPSLIGAAELSFTMKVDGVIVVNSGMTYTGATTTVFSAPTLGTTATGAPIIGVGAVTLLTSTNAGAGYAPDAVYLNIALLGGSGTGATADIGIVAGVVDSFQINNTGTGYLTGDTLTVDPSTFAPPPGTDATFTATSDYQTITGVTITNSGSGYTSMPTITIVDSGGGTLAEINATMKVDTVAIVSGSSGYLTAPTATFVGGGPTTTATIITTISSGSVVSTSLTNAGAGYTSFPDLQVESRLAGGSYPSVNWEIFNRPPNWATHYQIVRAKNSANNRFIQFIMDSASYTDKEGTVKTFGDPTITNMLVVVKNIYTDFLSENPGSILTYDFVPGDRMRFMNTTDYFDFAINSFNAGTGVVNIQFPIGAYPGDQPQFGGGDLFEIYNPQLTVTADEKLTFEIAECHNIAIDSNGNKYHEGVINQSYWDFNSSSYNAGFVQFSSNVAHGLLVGQKIKITQNSPFNNSSYNTYAVVEATPNIFTIRTNLVFGVADPSVTGTITRAATGVFDGGDTFYRPRTMPYASAASFRTFLIEDANYSDLWLSPGYDYGRPNRIDPTFKQITRQSTIYYSEKFIPETFINGLSTVYDTSFETYEEKYGGIYKLYNEDQNLIMFQELKVARIPIQQIIYNELNSNNTVGASEIVLGSQAIYYTGQFGIGKNPESFFVYANAKYFIDVRRGSPVRLSVDGLVAIGNIAFMHNYFTDKCRAILNSTSKIKIYGVYDIKFKEYIVAFSEGDGVTAETLAFNEKTNQWSTFYSYSPEGLCSNGIDVVSFKNGGLWMHNTNATQNNFYGTQYYSEVWCILNQEPSNVKVFQALSEESLDVWEAYEISNTNGQLSNLIAQDFQMKEGMQYAPLWFDQNTPNIVIPLINGDSMRAQTFLVKLKLPQTTYNKLFAVNFDYSISNLHR